MLLTLSLPLPCLTLKELVIDGCYGQEENYSSLFTAAAPSVERLLLWDIHNYYKVDHPFLRLKEFHYDYKYNDNPIEVYFDETENPLRYRPGRIAELDPDYEEEVIDEDSGDEYFDWLSLESYSEDSDDDEELSDDAQESEVMEG